MSKLGTWLKGYGPYVLIGGLSGTVAELLIYVALASLHKSLWSSEAAEWASAIASSVAVVVALSGYRIADLNRRADRRNADIDAAQLIGIKLFKISNSTADLAKQFFDKDGQLLKAEPGGWLWQKVFGMTGIEVDESVELTGDEIGLLVRIRQVDFLTEMTLATKRLRSIIRSLEVYARKRDELHLLLPPPVEVEGLRGSYPVTIEQRPQVALNSAVLDQMLVTLRDMLRENMGKTERLSIDFHPMMKAAFPDEAFIKLEPAPHRIWAPVAPG